MPGQKFSDFTEVEAEIVRETDRVTGRNKVCRISDDVCSLALHFASTGCVEEAHKPEDNLSKRP